MLVMVNLILVLHAYNRQKHIMSEPPSTSKFINGITAREKFEAAENCSYINHIDCSSRLEKHWCKCPKHEALFARNFFLIVSLYYRIT